MGLLRSTITAWAPCSSCRARSPTTRIAAGSVCSTGGLTSVPETKTSFEWRSPSRISEAWELCANRTGSSDGKAAQAPRGANTLAPPPLLATHGTAANYSVFVLPAGLLSVLVSAGLESAGFESDLDSAAEESFFALESPPRA